MAVLGTTKLEAVQHMMAAAGRRAPSALDTGGASEESEAERVLDMAIRAVQTEGYEANYRKGVEYTADGSGNITFAATILRVQCVAPGRYAGRVVLKEDAAYCVTENSANFGASTKLYFDIWEELTWDQCPPDLKERILSAATVDYIARLTERAKLMEVLSGQLANTDRHVQRAMPDLTSMPPNTSPGGIPAVRSGRDGAG